MDLLLLFMLAPKHGFQPQHECEYWWHRPARASAVPCMRRGACHRPSAVNVIEGKCACTMTDEPCSVTAIRNVLLEAPLAPHWANDFVPEYIDRQALVGIAKPGQLQPATDSPCGVMGDTVPGA